MKRSTREAPPLDVDWRQRLDPDLVAAAADVDRSLLRWSQNLSVRERLRACSKAGAALSRYRREPSEAG